MSKMTVQERLELVRKAIKIIAWEGNVDNLITTYSDMEILAALDSLTNEVDAIETHIAEQDKTIEMQHKSLKNTGRLLAIERKEITMLKRAMELMSKHVDLVECLAWKSEIECDVDGYDSCEKCWTDHFKAQAAKELVGK
ncbi:hypothetical protein LCGC14_2965150 [marine sediment metagenome]|uniref:Uncharacterized protein n=1 Tax=marine sediment metagenome TaxID=412755 RepID=A0A0F8XBX5_9ZZZZ